MEYKLFKPSYIRSGERRRSATFNIRFRDHLNRRQTLAASERERDAHTLAGRVMELVQIRRRGEALDARMVRWLDAQPRNIVERLTDLEIIDPVAATAETTLLDHLEGRKDADGKVIEPGYRAKLVAKRDTDQHVNQQITRIRELLDHCEFAHYRDLVRPGAALKVEVWLGKRRDDGEINGATFNHYIGAVKGFCRWLAKEGKAPTIALASLEKVDNPDMDAKPRRELSVGELDWLVGAAEKGRDRFKVNGAERALLYRVSFYTGLRPGTVRKLTVGDFDVSANPAIVTCPAKSMKRRKLHPQVVHSALVETLNKRFKDKPATATAFTMPSRFDMADMLRADLAEARALWLKDAATDQERPERAAE